MWLTAVSATLGGHVASASTVEELLSVVDLLVLAGEEVVHWQRQPIHHQRRQIAASHALRRLAKLLCGVSSARRCADVVASPQFSRLCQAAALPCPGMSPAPSPTPSPLCQGPLPFTSNTPRAIISLLVPFHRRTGRRREPDSGS